MNPSLLFAIIGVMFLLASLVTRGTIHSQPAPRVGDVWVSLHESHDFPPSLWVQEVTAVNELTDTVEYKNYWCLLDDIPWFSESYEGGQPTSVFMAGKNMSRVYSKPESK